MPIYRYRYICSIGSDCLACLCLLLIVCHVVSCRVCVRVCRGGGGGGGTLGIFLKDFLLNTSLLSASSRDVT